MAKGRGRPPGRGATGAAGASGSAGKVLLGVVLGGAAVAAGGYLYLHTTPGAGSTSRPETATGAVSGTTKREPGSGGPNGKTPAARAEAGADAAHPLAADRQPPFGASEDVFEAGAAVYAQRCVSCHGTTRHDAAGANGQRAVQLFRGGRERAGSQTPAQVFAAINLGAQGLGMPAYHGILTEQQIWQVVLLLRSAAEPLPDPVMTVLDGKGR